ncbi:MAG TPA: site-specific integrase [Pricia sp.]|nr:site-specific integrase [Pricia sp.]
MATINVILRKKGNKKGLFPISVRVTKDRKSTYLYTGQYLDPKFWDETKQRVKKSHPNSSRLNNLIAIKQAEANAILLDTAAKDGDHFSVRELKSQLTTTLTGHSFFEYAEKHFKQLEESKKLSRIDSERPLLNRIKDYVGEKALSFDQITVSFIRGLKSYLKARGTLGDRSIANILMFIRTLYNRAIQEKLVKQESYPFGSEKGKIRIKIPQSFKIGLTDKEIVRIENLNLSEHPPQNHARNVWLFSFYLAGMRIADVLKIRWKDIQEGRLYYQMNKNSKVISLKISDKLQNIINQYADSNLSIDEFIFPELKGIDHDNIDRMLRSTKNATLKFNKHLKKIAEKAEISKKITMHIARHSFGNIAGDKIHPLMLQKLYRHSDLKTTINYQANFIHKEADEALDAVINF